MGGLRIQGRRNHFSELGDDFEDDQTNPSFRIFLYSVFLVCDFDQNHVFSHYSPLVLLYLVGHCLFTSRQTLIGRLELSSRVSVFILRLPRCQEPLLLF